MTVATESLKKHSGVKGGARRPKYLQLAEQIRAQIEDGIRQPGEQLPSFAQMKSQHNLSQSTLEKMYQVLEEQTLIVREAGRGIFVAQPSRSRTGQLGLLSNHIPENHPFYLDLLAGTREAARRDGMEVLLLNDVKTAKWEKVDGVVICYGYAEQLLQHLPPFMPRVSLLFPLRDTPSVVTDDYNSMTQAMEYLLSLGHRRIAFTTVAAARGTDSLSRQRLIAYHDVLKAHKISPKAGWVQNLHEPYERPKKFMEAGRAKMRRWLSQGWEELGCTALLVQNDDAAIGVIEALQEAGIRVPQDVSVVGFDGTDIAEYFRPKLTTVKVPLKEIGRRGTEILIDEIMPSTHKSAADGGPISIVISSSLQIGQSTAPPPK